VGVEKLFSWDFTNEIRSQVIESSFAAGAEIHTNYCFGSFFNSHAWFQQSRRENQLNSYWENAKWLVADTFTHSCLGRFQCPFWQRILPGEGGLAA